MSNSEFENNIEDTNLIIEKLRTIVLQKYPNKIIKITEIKNNIFAIESSSGNIGYYMNKDGENISSHSGQRLGNPDYNKLLNQLGYKEEKIGQEYIISRIRDNSLVDKYSLEYFYIPKSIYFLDSLKYLQEALTSKNRLSRNQALELIPTFISAGSLKISELESFLTRGSITKEDFEKFLPKMKKLLKEQTIDERGNMKKFGKEVTEEEIKDYYEKGYIDQKEALELYEIIKKREEKSEKVEEITKQTISSLDVEKNEYIV